MIVALAGFGGLGYAASVAVHTVNTVKRVAEPNPAVTALGTPAQQQYGTTTVTTTVTTVTTTTPATTITTTTPKAKPAVKVACKRGEARVKGKCVKVRKGKVTSARLSASHFSHAQVALIRLNCKFSPKTKYLSYVITRKDGKKQKIVRSVRLTGSFANYTASIRNLFLGKPVLKGVYRIKLSADGNSKTLSFIVS
jgi:hypothetical protein